MPSVQAIVNRQIQRWMLESQSRREAAPGSLKPGPVITISRTLGSGGAIVAGLVAQRMNLQLCEKEILEEMARQSEVRRELVEHVDEHSRSRIESWVDGILRNKIFDEGDYYHHLLQVLRSLLEMGSVVIVGRGANFVLPDRPTLHVRIVAPLEDRIVRIMEFLKLTRAQAEKEIHRSDADRARFIKRLFDADWDDPLAYHLVINTGQICLACAAALIEMAWTQRIAKQAELEQRDQVE